MDWKRLSLWTATAVFVSACAVPGLTTPMPATVPPTLTATPTFTPNPPSPTSTGTPVPPSPTVTFTPVPYVPPGPVIEHIPAGKDVRIRLVKMFDNLNGWGLVTWKDAADHLLRTTDGGLTWHDVTPPEPPAAAGNGKTALPYFLDPSTAWMIYSNIDGSLPQEAATVWSTRDGGATWQPGQGITPDASGGSFSPTYMDFIDPQNGWLLVALGAGMNHVYSALYRTTDGGRNWVPLITPYDDGGIQSCAKTGMVFISAKYGWLTTDCHGVAPVPYIFNTLDGGRTWAKVDLPAPPDQPNIFGDSYCGVFDPALSSPQAGMFTITCQEYGDNRAVTDYLYRTVDSGNTWQITSFPGGTLAVLYDQTLYAISRTIYRSDDGGATWVEVKTVYWDPLVSFLDKNIAWAVAANHGEYALVKTVNGCVSWDEIRSRIAP
jgi:hypothetical protein